MTYEEVETIGRWIDAGAPTCHPELSVLPTPGELIITERERHHWAICW